MKYYLLFISILFSVIAWTQNDTNFKSIRSKRKKDSITFTARDYKIISFKRDTIAIDTSLTIKNAYKHNPFGKDMFQYIGFSNMGQTFNALAYDLKKETISPKMGATANNFYYTAETDVPYYYLPTPITQFTYKTGMEQGQILKSLFSANINPRTNIFISYDALRSLGNYQNILSSYGNFTGGISYISPNKKYWILGHYSHQDVFHQENGGLALREQFEGNDAQFNNRAVVDVAFTDAENEWMVKRYFINHQYNFLPNKSKSHILLKHLFNYETKTFSFHQTNQNSFFGNSYVPSEISDRMKLKTLTNKIGAELQLPYVGKTFIFGKSYFYNYFFRNIFYNSGNITIPNKISGTNYGLGFEWQKNYKGISVAISGEQMFIGSLLGTDFQASMQYHFNKQNQIKAGIKILSAMPSFNKLLYQSDYKNYNWYHFSDFKPENTQIIFANFNTKWGNFSADISNINQFTYFGLQTTENSERLQSVPKQHSQNIQYLKLIAEKEFHLGKFALDNTLMYQQVSQNENIINVPTFTTRNTLYFSDHLFKKALFLQTGISFKYFTKYYANRYNPLLAEFEVQNQEKTGNFPMFDIFINVKIRTMRIFLKYEHINARFTGRNYYAAPEQPYRDRVLRFGITWNFFS